MNDAAISWTAYLALLAWPLVSLALYRFQSFTAATAWTFLGALLLLPAQVAIKIPMIPSIDKNSIASLSASIGFLFFDSRARRSKSNMGLFVGILAIAFVFGPVITAALNNDVIVLRDILLPGVGYYDGISAMLSQIIVIAPFFIGRLCFRNAVDTETILKTLVIGGTLFTLPMLFEIRMSPQLSTWIYGYFPSSFATESRYGGYRPVVFMINGLAAAFLLCTAFIAALTLQRSRSSSALARLPVTSSYLAIVLVLCKSAGALIYAIIIGAIARLVSPRGQLRVAVLLIAVALFYPILRVTNYFPTTQLFELATVFNKERADSLKYRFDQEEALLAHASERFLFGWGRYGRNRVYEESGKDVSITDGLWIITLGTFGFVGFIAQFGLLALPVFRAARALHLAKLASERNLLSGLSLIVAITAIEQLPNSSIAAWSWFLVGALLGRAEQLHSATKRKVTPTVLRIDDQAIQSPAAIRS